MTAWFNLFHRSEQKKEEQGQKTSPKEKSFSILSVPKIRLVFMGTPGFSANLLEALLEKGYHVVGVVTQPDKPVGREQKMIESEVKRVALKHKIPLLQPQRLDSLAIEVIQGYKPDLIVVAAYGKILPKAVLSIPGFGCINFHTSLLPKWRGSSPIQNAILAGEQETGVTIMLMDEGMDTGDILSQKRIPLASEDTTYLLSEKLFSLGQDLLIETIPLWVKQKIVPRKQDHAQATLCQLIEREDGHINWTDDAEDIYNRYRALTPWPGIFSFWKKDGGLLRLKLVQISFQKQSSQTTHALGEIFEIGEKIGVQTGNGIVFLEEVQLEGKSPVAIADFILGNTSLLGSLLQ